MPELPEVETMCRGIAQAVGGRVVGVYEPDCPRRPIVVEPPVARIHARLVGRRVEAIERAGKRVVLRFDSQDRLVIEPRMTGLVLVADPPSVEHLRLRIELAGSPLDALWFWDRRGLGVVRLLDPGQYDARLGPHALGPDALTVDEELLRRRLGAGRRPIKVALLDQQAVAGIGNLYASEILHVAGVHPELRCEKLGGEQWKRLATAVRDVLEEAVRYEGSTLGDGTYRNAVNQPGGYQNHHRVYDREGETCPDCGAEPIRRIVQAQRSTFFCPRCQPRTVKGRRRST